MKTIIRETNTTNLVELCQWCRDYEKFNVYPCSAERRFIIATYQLAQAIAWQDVYNYSNRACEDYESFAAGALHFIMVAEKFNICLPSFSVDYPNQIIGWPTTLISYRNYALNHGRVAQQLIYGARVKDIKRYSRGSRYSEETLGIGIRNLVRMLFQHIPIDKRAEAIEQASSIMTRKL